MRRDRRARGRAGYPATAAEMRKRLLGIKPASLHAVFVADAPEDGVIGWVHVSKQPLLEDEIRAEVNGLVVAEGSAAWGRARGCWPPPKIGRANTVVRACRCVPM